HAAVEVSRLPPRRCSPGRARSPTYGCGRARPRRKRLSPRFYDPQSGGAHFRLSVRRCRNRTMMMRTNQSLRRAVVIAVTIAVLPIAFPCEIRADGICDNAELLRAVRVIDNACSVEFCDPHKLREIEDVPRADLLRALRDPSLMPVHIFFPSGKTRLNDAFDWETIKEDQLRTI